MSIDLSGKNKTQSDASTLHSTESELVKNLQAEEIPIEEVEPIPESDGGFFESQIPEPPKNDKDFSKKEKIAIQTEKINIQQNSLREKKANLEAAKAKIDEKIRLSKTHNAKLAEKRQKLKIRIIKIKKSELELQVKQLKLDLKNAQIDIRVDKRLARMTKK